MNAPFRPGPGRRYGRAFALRRLATLKRLDPATRRRVIAALPPPAVRALDEEWWWQAHGGQHEPDGDWRIWAIVAGRGFGKTRAGAEWVWQRARENSEARIALVAASLDEVAKVMVEGESGLLAVARSGEEPRWRSSRGIFRFPSGAEAYAWTAERPDKLRGPQHHFAWCDELAKWPHGDATWHNLMLGLRLGGQPRTIVTTTPRAVPLLKRILALPRGAVTRGRTDENPHLPADFREAVTQMYGGTRLGRQELDGMLFDDPEGALWTRAMLEAGRAPDLFARRRRDAEESGALPPREADFSPDPLDFAASPENDGGQGPSAPPRLRGNPVPLSRVVIGLDPPASASGDACGLSVCGLDGAGIAWVLADLTASGLSPEGWARRVANAAAEWEASLIMAEKNQGGEMIEAMLRGVDARLPVRLVPATKSKAARAEPVALAFETGKAKLAGSFPELEDQMCAMTYRGYQGESSPDRLDAMVWAMGELIRPAREPRIMVL